MAEENQPGDILIVPMRRYSLYNPLPDVNGERRSMNLNVEIMGESKCQFTAWIPNAATGKNDRIGGSFYIVELLSHITEICKLLVSSKGDMESIFSVTRKDFKADDGSTITSEFGVIRENNIVSIHLKERGKGIKFPIKPFSNASFTINGVESPEEDQSTKMAYSWLMNLSRDVPMAASLLSLKLARTLNFKQGGVSGAPTTTPSKQPTDNEDGFGGVYDDDIPF